MTNSRTSPERSEVYFKFPSVSLRIRVVTSSLPNGSRRYRFSKSRSIRTCKRGHTKTWMRRDSREPSWFVSAYSSQPIWLLAVGPQFILAVAQLRPDHLSSVAYFQADLFICQLGPSHGDEIFASRRKVFS